MNNHNQLRMQRIAYPVTALGPGNRLALWVAGCSLNCKGCITPELQAKDSGKAIDISVLAEHILSLPTEFDGVSLTGGEPFEQAAALASLLGLVIPERKAWSVLTFSGFPYDKLRRQRRAQKLLAYTDMLIDGPYNAKAPSTDALIASDNQGIRVLSPVGQDLFARLNNTQENLANLGISPTGPDVLIGIVHPHYRKTLHQSLGAQALYGELTR